MSIRDQVLAALDAADGPAHPALIAQELAASVDDPREVLAEVLPVFVREVIVTSRRSSTTPAAGQTRTAARGDTAGGRGRTNSTRSAKVVGIREHWRAQLDARYATAEGYKRLADFTLDDLDALVAGEAALDAAGIPEGSPVAVVPDETSRETLYRSAADRQEARDAYGRPI